MNRTPIVALVCALGFGCGAACAADLMSKDAYKAEKDRIKAMHKTDEDRCKSLAGNAKDICHAEASAREKGISRLVLETGEAPGFEAAYRVYERGGFTACGAVLDYPDSGFSRFYEKKISS